MNRFVSQKIRLIPNLDEDGAHTRQDPRPPTSLCRGHEAGGWDLSFLHRLAAKHTQRDTSPRDGGTLQECPPLLEPSWRRLERSGRNLPDGKGDGGFCLWRTACGTLPRSAGGLRRSAEAHAHIFRDAVRRLWPPWQLGRLSPGS